MVKLDIVHPSLLPKLWPLVEDRIIDICGSTNGRMGVDDVKEFIINQDILLWCAFDKEIEAVGLTEIRNYRGRKMLVILGVTGRNMENWKHYMPQMEDFAKSTGCDGIESVSRKGWARVLDGFTQSHVFIEKMFASNK